MQYCREDPTNFADNVQKELCLKIEELISRYNYEIAAARDSKAEDKVRVIVNFIHCMAMLHPFLDGNTRTMVFLLMNRLLIQNGFPPGMFDNPNRFDGYSTKELRSYTLQAIKRTRHFFKVARVVDRPSKENPVHAGGSSSASQQPAPAAPASAAPDATRCVLF